jgi:hypothetical protein
MDARGPGPDPARRPPPHARVGSAPGRRSAAPAVGSLSDLQARAGNRTVGEYVRRFGPGSPSVPPALALQRHNAADHRVVANPAEGAAFAASAAASITAALGRFATDPSKRRRNVADTVNHLPVTVSPLIPTRGVGPAAMEFRTGAAAAPTGTLVLTPATPYAASPNPPVAHIAARDDADVDTLLPAADLERRLEQAIGELAERRTTQPPGGAEQTIDIYRARFNALWDDPVFAGLSGDFNPALGSQGPRTPRARLIFTRILAGDPALRGAYDAGGATRDRMDTYLGPEGLNRLSSVRVMALRDAVTAGPAPVPAAGYAAWLAAVRPPAQALDAQDRQAVLASNQWEQLLNEWLLGPVERAEVRALIATAPAAPAPAPPAPAPAPAPGHGPTGGAAGAGHTFVNGITLDAPGAPTLAVGRDQPVTLTPRSPVPNPAPPVPVRTRITVTPAARVRGAGTSPESPWPAASADGSVFSPTVINEGTVTMRAHLDLLGLPAGLTRGPVADHDFVIQDDRQTHLLATWGPAVRFDSGGGGDWFTGAQAVRYRGGTQNFALTAALPAGQVNPGVTVFVRAQIRRGAAVVVPPPPLVVFPPDQQFVTPIAMPVNAPPVVPAAGDPLTFLIELIAADRTTVLATRAVVVNVLPEIVYTQAQAQAAAVADQLYLTGPAPGALLARLTARGGVARRVADAIRAGLIQLRPLTARHDSAAYVAAVSGSADPSKVGYFVGTAYVPAPDPHSFVGVAGAAAFSLGRGDIVVNRTTDVAAGTRRVDDEIIMLTIHESVHALDIRPGAGTVIEEYKTEFRAYWMDGRYGPPDGAVPLVPDPNFHSTAYDETMTPPGPKSPRARAIFNTVYGSATYPRFKPAYDNNIGGFRAAVDSYLVPDGINLVVSRRLEALRALISAHPATLLHDVRQFTGTVAPPPALGVLQADERTEITGNMAWRDLVESSVPHALVTPLKTELGIPR